MNRLAITLTDHEATQLLRAFEAESGAGAGNLQDAVYMAVNWFIAKHLAGGECQCCKPTEEG